MATTLAELLQSHSDRILLRVMAGSQAHGLATEQSDSDERGVFALPAAAYVALSTPVEHLQDERGNVIFFGLRKFLALASAANPSALEILFAPADTVLFQAPAAAALFAARQRFVTRRCVDSHVGYARARIQRARGQNKWILPDRRGEVALLDRVAAGILRS
jgi:predicted nucleotidyltransferase